MPLDSRDPPPVAAQALRHLPGDPGLPWLGQTLDFLRDPLAFARRQHQTYGPVSTGRFLYSARVFLTSAEGNEALLTDRAGAFSARLGWNTVLGQLFPRGLMLRDGEDHRLHRRLMQPAFRAEALAGYLGRMNPRIDRALHDWAREPDFHFYPAIKRLTLDIAAEVFLGLELREEIDQVNTAFTDLVEASAAIIRLRGLGRRWTRGLTGRERLAALIRARIPERRRQAGSDLFSQLCAAEDEHGNRYEDSEIVDHLIFLMMAAHDTTTSALTTLAYLLAANPDWQMRLREQALARPGPLDAEGAKAAEDTGLALREALRLYPPLTTMVRQAIKPFELHGYTIPAGASCAIFPVWTQRDPQWWREPERFDPDRFAAPRAEHRRHPFAWAPFGGGAHRCLGLHFAEMQVKAVLHALLQRFALTLAPGYRLPYQLAPIAKPKDGLPIRLVVLGP